MEKVATLAKKDKTIKEQYNNTKFNNEPLNIWFRNFIDEIDVKKCRRGIRS